MSDTNLYWPALLHAAEHTLQYTVYSVVGSMILGLVLALMKVAPLRIVRAVAIVYTELFRNSPLLLVIFVVYFGLPEVGLTLSALVAGCLSMSLFFGAYLSEIFRGGLEGVPVGQREAGYANGLSTYAVYRHIVLPQAVRLSLAATGNMVVDILKSTSLLATIAANELLTSAQSITSETFKPMQAYLIVGAIYFVMCFPISRLIVWYEAALKSGRQVSLRRRRISRHLARLELGTAVTGAQAG